MERTKVTIIRTSMPISSGSCEVKGPVIRNVNNEVILLISTAEVEELGSFETRERLYSRVLA
jgi:hypothetical protein